MGHGRPIEQKNKRLTGSQLLIFKYNDEEQLNIILSISKKFFAQYTQNMGFRRYKVRLREAAG